MHKHSVNQLAQSATLHCLTGCALGEVSGLVIGMLLGMSTAATIALAITLAFLFGYALSIMPLLRGGVSPKKALTLVLAADTLSIATMEIVDNVVMAMVPGAMGSGVVNPLFWVTMPAALAVAYVAAYPVNRILLQRQKGHALLMQHHDSGHHHDGHTMAISPLLYGLAGFFLAGLLVSIVAA